MGTSDYLEEDVEDALVGGIEALHGLCWKLKMPWFTGVPDRMVLLPGGRIIFVELKKPKGRKSKLARASFTKRSSRSDSEWRFYGRSKQ
jgi:hypothetical protein